MFASLDRPPDAVLLSSLLLDTLDGARLQGTTRVVAVEPAEACGEVRALVPAEVRVVPQAKGTLGDRMRTAMGGLFAEGASAVVLIGSDLPDITPRVIEHAISHLARDRDALVLGPAADGGYYLIAATTVPDVFDGIEWGGPHVLEQTRRAAARSGLHVYELEPMRDVDTPDDLRTVVARRTRSWWASQR
ncbi:MAG TPA: TIGR04282 family arsenosugar biosynthesis glycosyltransferase [Pseudomonadales bacterium]|nr:TIGR04282 family arsenosugar biosynthesis glycosyltransferase [Pseudomonadales bacterium]